MTRIAILSDIHAFRPEPLAQRFLQKDPSWARTLPDHFERDRGPFEALERLIAESSLSADYVFCCGDMGDKADLEGIRYAWSWLEVFRRRLDAKLVIGTTGNHDVDSRDQSGTGDPMHCTRVLQPPFPLDIAETRQDYWDNNVALHADGDLEVLIVNSAAEHETEELAKRGRVTEGTLREIEARVGQTKSQKRIALLHHHPYRHDAIDWTDPSELDGGPELLRILEEDGDWLVIHGHRHYPNLVYAAGGTRAPTIFAAGSFSAMLYPELQSRVRNQFHIIEIGPPGSVAGTAGMIGQVRTWEYTPARGWCAPTSQEGIPDGAGFGFRGSIDDSAQLVADFVKASAETYVVLEDVFLMYPRLRYMIPSDRARMLGLLIGKGIAVSPKENRYSMLADEIFLKDLIK